ncbi:MAG: hypothetical protein LBU65_03360 [Planctomycetaceae bacterium]|nr:hypothetical protein [Planctomycetaceae bacterium]
MNIRSRYNARITSYRGAAATKMSTMKRTRIALAAPQRVADILRIVSCIHQHH